MSRVRRALAAASVAALLVLGAGAGLVEADRARPLPAGLLSVERSTPSRALDRRGRLLRETVAADGTRGRWVALEEISPRLVEATIAAEDRRFLSHEGVDPLALLRAAAQNLASGRRVSGASTLTMQLARLLRPAPRTWASKLEEARLALRLERSLSKEEILEQYLNRAPYGGNVVGAEAAALRTFGKPARDLSPAEAALLAALPQGPARLDPHRSLERARRRARWILDEMRRAGALSEAEHARAVAEAPALSLVGAPSEAPEAVDWIAAREPREGGGPLRTTLDLDLQREVEAILRASRAHLEEAGAREAAAVVLDVRTAEVLAFAGPAGRRRLPGSTLKPFVYALGLEAGTLTAASPLEDAPVHLGAPGGGDYAPRNYDGRFHGRVTVRQALANSLNVPAVLALREVGVPREVRLLRALGLEGVPADPARSGLGLALGDAQVSPVELAGAYATLARGGRFVAPRGRLRSEGEGAETSGDGGGGGEGGGEGAGGGAERGLPAPLLSPETCAIAADILADDAARALAFGEGSEIALPFPVAAKTGTSAGWRDNWVAGFTAERAVAVWVGNPDGRPLRGTSGLAGAGPIFRAVMLRLEERRRAAPRRAEAAPPEEDGGARCGPLARPPGVVEREVCASSGRLAGPACAARALELFASVHLPPTCDGAYEAGASPLALVTPRPGDRFRVDARPGAASAGTRFVTLEARAAPGVEVAWEIDGVALARTVAAEAAGAPGEADTGSVEPAPPSAGRHSVVWPAAPGVHEVVARAAGVERRARFEVEARR